MANWKKIGTGLGVLIVVAAAGAGAWLYTTFDTSRSDVADDTTPLSQVKITDADAIKRGEYVMRMGDCAACHTSGQGEFAGGYTIATDFGALVSSNITPDEDTGIGKMTERDFFNAVRQGIGSHGLLYPAMPFPAYTRMTDEDMHDLWAYMSTLEPVKNDIDETAGMKFPFNIRLAMAGWDMLFFHNKAFEQDGSQDETWNRGKYLVDGAAHCATCHSPRNALGGYLSGKYLQGASLGTWSAPDITSNGETGIGWMSTQDLSEYLKTGATHGTVASGPMAEAVEHSFQYLSDDDLNAISTYVLSLPASDNVADAGVKLGEQMVEHQDLKYEVNCAACHGVKGEGIKGMVPALAGNRRITDNDPTNLIHVMLKGTRAAHTETLQTAAGMPSYAWKMDDRQIADLLTYVRNAWGNKGSNVSMSQVANMRKVLGARSKVSSAGD